IAETRTGTERTQRYGIYVMPGAGPVQAQDNVMENHVEKDYLEAKR
ncbi:MAG: hypothetical protein H6Q06_1304, partial [Acidobacteria bacterium]|nr:hypothetical protein [Acidobacteriota bacterium]